MLAVKQFITCLNGLNPVYMSLNKAAFIFFFLNQSLPIKKLMIIQQVKTLYIK